jgi:hypothetical protein
MLIASLQDRLDLYERQNEIGDEFPEFMHHSPVTNENWHVVSEHFPD